MPRFVVDNQAVSYSQPSTETSPHQVSLSSIPLGEVGKSILSPTWQVVLALTTLTNPIILPLRSKRASNLLKKLALRSQDRLELQTV